MGGSGSSSSLIAWIRTMSSQLQQLKSPKTFSSCVFRAFITVLLSASVVEPEHKAALYAIVSHLHLISHYWYFPSSSLTKWLNATNPLFCRIYANSIIISCVLKQSSMMQLKKSAICRRLNRGSFSALRRPCCWWHAEVSILSSMQKWGPKTIFNTICYSSA